jgi:hypothetical protein
MQYISVLCVCGVRFHGESIKEIISKKIPGRGMINEDDKFIMG